MKITSLNNITWRESPVWLRCLAIFVAINFLTFFIISTFFLRGDALSGGVNKAHYFLGSKGHRVWEVSAAIYYYSLVHTVTAIAGIPILGIAIVQVNYRKPFSKLKFRND